MLPHGANSSPISNTLILPLSDTLPLCQSERYRPTFSDDVHAAVDAAFAKKKEQNPHLYDDPLLMLQSGTAHGLERCFFLPYRYWLCQSAAPYDLKLMAIAVSGLIISNGYALFGKRNLHMTLSSGLWECVPSGGISLPCHEGQVPPWRAQLIKELKEECGLPPPDSIKPLCMIEQPEEKVIDICAVLHYTTAARTQTLYSESDEYTRFLWLPENKLARWLRSERIQRVLVSTTYHMLCTYVTRTHVLRSL